MDQIYYQPNHLWKGKAAVKKLAEYSKEKPKTVKQWLSRQAFWQVHLPALKFGDKSLIIHKSAYHLVSLLISKRG